MTLKRNLPLLMTFAFLTSSLANAQDPGDSCKIRVVPMGPIVALNAGNAEQVKFPNFKYAIVKEQVHGAALPVIEVMQKDLANRVLAEEQARTLSSNGCPKEDGLRCEMKIDSLNRVGVEVAYLDQQNHVKKSVALRVATSAVTHVQDNLNLLGNNQSALGCRWERGAFPQCEVTRSFSFAHHAPEYAVKMGHPGRRILSGLTYEQARDLAQAWTNSDGTPPNVACRFTQMPDSLMCSVDYKNGKPVLRFEQMGTSSHFDDYESACNTLMDRVTLGECGVSSPIGEDPCIHSGVSNNPRDPFAAAKYGEHLNVSEESGPIHDH